MSKQVKAPTVNFINDADILQAEFQAARDNLERNIGEQSRIRTEINQVTSGLGQLRDRAAASGVSLDIEIRDQEEKLGALRTEAEQVEHALRSTNTRHGEITLALEALGAALSLEDVLAFLDTVRETEERMTRLRGLIDQQLAIQREAGAFENRLLELEERREDLRAAHAIGDATEKELNDINAAIANEEAQVATVFAEADDKITAAEQTIIGLTRLLEEATANHDHLLKHQPQIVANFLRSKGACIGKQYLEAAEALIGKFKQLVALDRLCIRLMPEWRGGPGLLARGWGEMYLPALHGERGYVRLGEMPPTTLFSASGAQFTEQFSESAQELEQELADAGIPL